MADVASVEELIKDIPAMERIKWLPRMERDYIVKHVNNFFIEHKLVKSALERCNFEQGFRYFGEAQQSKGRALELVDGVYRKGLLSSKDSNDIVKYILDFNETKIRDFITKIKVCEHKHVVEIK